MPSKPRKVKCPSCRGQKDYRAKQCAQCRMRYNHPHTGTAQGWKLHSTGYITAFIDNRWQYQHRYVMEQELGRRLKTDEHVHHKDGDKTNNKLSNLELLSKSKHAQEHMKGRAKEMSKLGHKKRWGYVSDI